MTRREAWLSAAAVGAMAVLVRVWASGIITFPRPEDTAYYVGVARNLLEGRGLVTNAIWSYSTPPLVFPRPAFEVWLPLPSLLAAVPMALLGSTFASAQWSSVIAGALVAVLAWRLAADVAVERGFGPGRARSLALGSGLTAAAFLPLVLHSALPDSTMPFAAIVLTVCLLAGRIAREPRGALLTDRRVLALGLLLGLGALTRNEAAWLAIGWVLVARGIARDAGPGRAGWARLVAGAAIPAMLVFAPWAIRDWMVFGNPLPGQALMNALSLNGRDIFAWSDPPTLARYLSAGLPALLAMRWDGFVHNLVNVLLVPGGPIALAGLVSIPWTIRGSGLRLVAIYSVLAFAITTLLFPIATQWGTFLHASGAVQVFLIVSALLGFDGLLAAIGRRRGWTRPVAWLGSTAGFAAAAIFTVALLPVFAQGGDSIRDRYAAMPAALASAGAPLPVNGGAVITNFPIWLAEETGTRALALPNESPEAVLDLARTFPGTNLVIVIREEGGIWPAVATTDPAGLRCFEPVNLPGSAMGRPDDPLAGVVVFRITCP